MENIQYITLDILNNKSYDYVYTKQYDTGRQVIFSFTKDSSPLDISGVSAVFYMRKPNDEYISITDSDDEMIINNDNTITLVLSDRITDQAGKLPYQITFVDGTKKISTITGIILCDESPLQIT